MSDLNYTLLYMKVRINFNLNKRSDPLEPSVHFRSGKEVHHTVHIQQLIQSFLIKAPSLPFATFQPQTRTWEGDATPVHLLYINAFHLLKCICLCHIFVSPLIALVSFQLCVYFMNILFFYGCHLFRTRHLKFRRFASWTATLLSTNCSCSNYENCLVNELKATDFSKHFFSRTLDAILYTVSRIQVPPNQHKILTGCFGSLGRDIYGLWFLLFSVKSTFTPHLSSVLPCPLFSSVPSVLSSRVLTLPLFSPLICIPSPHLSSHASLWA